jgi:hypothetical protein
MNSLGHLGYLVDEQDVRIADSNKIAMINFFIVFSFKRAPLLRGLFGC